MDDREKILGPAFNLFDYVEWTQRHEPLPVREALRIGIDPLFRCPHCLMVVCPTKEKHQCTMGGF